MIIPMVVIFRWDKFRSMDRGHSRLSPQPFLSIHPWSLTCSRHRREDGTPGSVKLSGWMILLASLFRDGMNRAPLLYGSPNPASSRSAGGGLPRSHAVRGPCLPLREQPEEGVEHPRSDSREVSRGEQAVGPAPRSGLRRVRRREKEG